MEMLVPCLFGLESFVSRELKQLDIEIKSVEDGKVTFLGDFCDMMRANLWLRTGERVLIKVCEFVAKDFDTLYNLCVDANWADYLPRDAKVSVSGHCLKSQLSSHPRCRAIIKKAIADSMGKSYNMERMPEDGAEYQVRFSFVKDKVTISIDTTGEGLHKRGYRARSNQAPVRETIAAGMVYVSRWRWENELCDPFCGSGTIPIEAAMLKLNIAPGLNREFDFFNFAEFDRAEFDVLVDDAKSQQKDLPLRIYASDIDESCVELTKKNAKLAGVDKYITVKKADARELEVESAGGTIICNPPYGERLSDTEACEELYREMGKRFSKFHNWSYYILASNENFESLFGRPATKRRKIYNGMMKCNIYQYQIKK